jgi:hypothetical protein
MLQGESSNAQALSASLGPPGLYPLKRVRCMHMNDLVLIACVRACVRAHRAAPGASSHWPLVHACAQGCPEDSLNAKTIENGYRDTAEAFGITDANESVLSLRSALAAAALDAAVPGSQQEPQPFAVLQVSQGCLYRDHCLNWGPTLAGEEDDNSMCISCALPAGCAAWTGSPQQCHSWQARRQHCAHIITTTTAPLAPPAPCHI